MQDTPVAQSAPAEAPTPAASPLIRRTADTPLPGDIYAWLKAGAEHGDAMAQFCLAVCYKHGQGGEKNPQEAVSWFRAAAEQGLSDAINNLGLCYSDGVGVEKKTALSVS